MFRLFIFISLIFSLTSCKIFKSNRMLMTKKNYPYDKLVDSLSRLDYRLAANDAIVYRVFTNDGLKLIDLTSTNNSFRSDIDAVIESDGQIKMPLIGRLHIAGLTISEAEKLIEEKYSEYYVKPFVTIRVNNKRVIVFPGNSGAARVVILTNNNTTILEAIASAGGIPDDGKAYKAKLIRQHPIPGNKPYVYLMDLSRIEGLKDGNSKVQAGDIIYVEPRYRPLRTFTTEISAVITLVTAFLILYQISKIVH